MTREEHVPTESGRNPHTPDAPGAGTSGNADIPGSSGTAGTADSQLGWTPAAPPSAAMKRDRTRTRAAHANRPLLLAAAAAVVLAVLIWLVVSLSGGSDDDTLADPSSVAAGACMADFTAITEDAAVVDCSEPHNAQLLASESYPEDAEFPGRDQLAARAEAACAAASESVDPDAVTADLRVTLLRATPTEGTWADGDRRVDCFAVVEDGATVTRSLLAP